jgi:two-component system C4-dicarboxylate transport sensor histidine kinase DctB
MAKVSHELRVPLSLISGSLQSIEQFVEAAAEYIIRVAQQATETQLRPDPELLFLAAEAPNLLGICRQGTTRIDHLLTQLRGYAAQRGSRPSAVIAVHRALSQAIELACAGRTRLPAIRCYVPADLHVLGDEAAISQVFINLISNAFEALRARNDGEVCIYAGLCDVPGCDSLPGAHVHIVVHDNGPGVAEDMRDVLFEPFRTSNAEGKGLGLGLAISREIAEAHGGRVDLDVSVRSGAAFVVSLPAQSSGIDGWRFIPTRSLPGNCR